jgi:L-alanine-DL-glutamate epimerase-like enolase superfamily enzyme
MRIVELTAHHVRVPLKRTIKHASHVRTETDNVIVRCVLGDGTVGYGEGVPRDYVTGETVDSSIRSLAAAALPKQLTPCTTFADAIEVATRLAIPTSDHRAIGGNAARCAVELSVLDAFGRAFGENLLAVVRAVAPGLYEPKESVGYSGIVTSARGLKLRLVSLGYRWFGFRQIKVKVGLLGHDDAQRLKIVRRRVGPNVDLRVDANEAWTPDEAAARIDELEPFGITSVEQPLRHEDAASLPALRKRVRVPIMLDESLCGMSDAEAAVATGSCDLFNLRLSKCGGFIPTLRLAEYAAAHGLGYQLGCQVGETAILSAAGRMFACGVKDIRSLEGSYDRHLVRESLSKDDITFGRGGTAPMLAGCGVGVRIDDAKLHAVTVRKETLIA